MSEPLASVQIDSGVVRSIVDAKIQAAIVQELSKTTNVLEGMVAAICSRKVDCDGNVSGYSYSDKYNLIEVLSRKAIEAEINAAIKEWVTTNAERIRNQVKRQLDANKLAKTFVDAVEKNLQAGFYASCSIKVEPNDK